MTTNINNSSGLLVVKPWTQEPNKSIDGGFTVASYRGFEGKEAWPEPPNKPLLVNGLAQAEQYMGVVKYAKQLIDCRLLYIIPRGIGEVPSFIKNDFKFLGYDYGYYISEYNHFSVVLNEILYGTHDELRGYTKMLNEYALLPSINLDKPLDRIRALLSSKGADIEDDEPSQIIAIYEFIGKERDES